MPQNNKYEIQSRREKVAEMYLQGIPQHEIGHELGVSQGQVSKDLQFMSKKWKESSIENTGKIIARELAKINKAEQRAWEAVEKNCSSKHLNIILECVDKRCKLLGIDKAESTTLQISISPKEWVK